MRRLGVTLESPSPAEAEVVEDKAFFANALADTHMLVTPTPRGGQIAADGVYSPKQDYRYNDGNGLVPPKIWVTEIGALYRLNCTKVTRRREFASVCKPHEGSGTLRFGQARQAKAAAFLLKSAVAPLPSGGRAVNRLYYYNLVDTPGFRYRNPPLNSGYSGRCRIRPTRVARCDPDDSGVIGSQADGLDVEREEGLSLTEFKRSKLALSEPGEARSTYCLLRDRKAREIRSGIVRRSCTSCQIWSR